MPTAKPYDSPAYVPGDSLDHRLRRQVLAIEEAANKDGVLLDFCDDHEDCEPAPEWDVGVVVPDLKIDTSRDLGTQVVEFFRGLADSVESRLRGAGLLPE